MGNIPTAPYAMPERNTKRFVMSDAAISDLTEPRRAAAELAGTAANFGAKLADQALDRHANMQYAEFRGYVNQQINEMQQYAADSNTDPTQIQPEWDRRAGEIEKRANSLSRRAREPAGNWWRTYGSSYQEQINTWTRDSMNNQALLRAYPALDQIANNNWETEAAARTAELRASGGSGVVSAEEVQMEEAHKIIDPLMTGANPVITVHQGNAMLKSVAARMQEKNAAFLVDRLYADLVEKHTDPSTGIIDASKAIEELNTMRGLDEQSVRSPLEARIAKLERVQQVKEQAAQEATLDALNKAIYEDDYETQYKLIENGIDGKGKLPEKEQGAYLKALKDAMTGKDVETNWDSCKKVYMAIDALKNDQMTYAKAMKTFVEEEKNLSVNDRQVLLPKLLEAKSVKANPVDQRIHRLISDNEQIGVLIPYDEDMEKLLTPEEYEIYESLDNDRKVVERRRYSYRKEVEAHDDYDKWRAENPDATTEDAEKWADDYFRPIKRETAKKWLGARMWTAYWATEDPIKAAAYKERMKKLTTPAKWKKGDTRVIGGVTYTYDGEAWSD
jgi:hypothetical protein